MNYVTAMGVGGLAGAYLFGVLGAVVGMTVGFVMIWGYKKNYL